MSVFSGPEKRKIAHPCGFAGENPSKSGPDFPRPARKNPDPPSHATFSPHPPLPSPFSLSRPSFLSRPPSFLSLLSSSSTFFLFLRLFPSLRHAHLFISTRAVAAFSAFLGPALRGRWGKRPRPAASSRAKSSWRLGSFAPMTSRGWPDAAECGWVKPQQRSQAIPLYDVAILSACCA